MRDRKTLYGFRGKRGYSVAPSHCPRCGASVGDRYWEVCGFCKKDYKCLDQANKSYSLPELDDLWGYGSERDDIQLWILLEGLKAELIRASMDEELKNLPFTDRRWILEELREDLLQRRDVAVQDQRARRLNSKRSRELNAAKIAEQSRVTEAMKSFDPKF